MEQKRSEKERERYRVSLMSSNLHSSLENRCWIVVLNFNNGLACDSFVCETLFSCRFYASRNKRRTFSRRVYASGHEQSVPNSLLENSRASERPVHWRENFLPTAFIDMDDVTAGRCVLLSRSPN